jgi:class 3 adenylate cyclase
MTTSGSRVSSDVIGVSEAQPSPGCPECSRERLAGRKYCGACGKMLRARCERRQVTVLMADVSGFTALSARLDPEQVSEIMHRTFDAVLEAVHEHGGTVNQFLGDGVMALFDDGPLEHHARQALGAALAIQQAVEAVRRDVRRTYGLEFRLRIGINTGPVVIGTIGAALRTDYTAMGTTAGAASGLVQIAEPGQIVLTEHTRALVDEGYGFVEFGAMPLTESGEAVVVYELSRGASHAEPAILTAA